VPRASLTGSWVAKRFRRAIVGCGLAAVVGLLVVVAVAAAAASGVDIAAVEGQSFTGNVVSGRACPLASATITWGDGTSSAGTSDGGTGIQGTHTYAEEGTYSGSVSYTYTPSHCPAGAQTASFQATVQDAALTAAGVDSSGAAGRSLVAVVAHLQDASPAGTADDLSAQIDWGDGSTSAGTVAAAGGGGFDVTGTHTYTDTGSYAVTASITDVGGSTTTANSTAHIAATASQPPSASLTTPADGATYSRGEVVRASYSCSPGGDGGTLKPDVAGCSAPVANGAPIDTATAGAHTFEVIATDTDGQVATAFSHYTILQPPPHTTITFGPADGSTVHAPPRFTFVSDDPGSRFECRLLTRPSAAKRPPPFKACSSPYQSPHLMPGRTYVFQVRAIDPSGQVDPAPPSRYFQYSTLQLLNHDLDVRVDGIEVTQGVQAGGCNACVGTLPGRNGGSPFAPVQANYQGVTMAAGHFTVVRVFASFTQPASWSSVSGATARLEVFDSRGSRISVLNPDSAPAALVRSDCGLCVSEKERANPGASFNFLVPWDATEHSALTFRAIVTPPVGFGLLAHHQCAICKANTFTLLGVPFVSTAIVPIHPIPLTVGGVRTSQSETQVFGDAQTILPVNLQIHPYEAPIALDAKIGPFNLQFPVNTTFASALVAARAGNEQLDSTQYPIGVFVNGTAGLGGSTLRGRVLDSPPVKALALQLSFPPVSIVPDAGRPLTAVMHEIGHGLGLVHADTGSGNPATGPHPDGTPDCGGNSNGQIGETWPPDNEGRLQSVGIDRRNWNIFQTGSLPRTIIENYPATGNRYYDFMSYCPAGGVFESQDWISLRNWNQLVAFHPPPQTLPAARDRRARPESGTPLRVIATVDSAGNTSVFDVAPGQQTAAEPTVGSPYRIELHDAADGTLTSVVPTTTTIHEDHQGSGVLLEATLPFAPSTASVVVSANGAELARRARSPHAPTAAILSPRSRSHIGRAKTTLVRWSAHDADGDRLTTNVDYSADGGRHWKVVAGSVGGSSMPVPSQLLSASRNGRLRVRVSDGFDVATAISGPLTVAGRSPLVHITTSGRGGRMRADGTLLLQGTAFDDADQSLTGRHLKWYAGRRLLARGELLTVHGLPPGATTIRLVATDVHGRSSQANLRFKVLAVPAAFLVVRAPMQVAAKARHLRIVVSSTVPAVFTIAGVRHPVDRKARAITVTIRPGRSMLRVKYALTSPGGVTRGTYVAAR